MSVSKSMLALALACAVLTALLTPVAAAAAERPRCLSRAEQRAAIPAGGADAVAVAGRARGQGAGGELVRARLCHDANRLIYLLTVLARDGKVRRVTVDATNGTVISGL